MADYLERVRRFFALIALVPLATGFAGGVSARVGTALFLFGLPVTLLTLVVGTLIWLDRGMKLRAGIGNRRAKTIVSGAAPLLFVVTLAALLPLVVAGHLGGSLTRLAINHARYEALVARAESRRGPAAFEEADGISYATDPGPPVRVGFHVEEMRSLWGAIVHDPSGEVMLAKGWDEAAGDFIGPERITRLFLGGMVGCQHLWGNYYSCVFDW